MLETIVNSLVSENNKTLRMAAKKKISEARTVVDFKVAKGSREKKKKVSDEALLKDKK